MQKKILARVRLWIVCINSLIVRVNSLVAHLNSVIVSVNPLIEHVNSLIMSVNPLNELNYPLVCVPNISIRTLVVHSQIRMIFLIFIRDTINIPMIAPVVLLTINGGTNARAPTEFPIKI